MTPSYSYNLGYVVGILFGDGNLNIHRGHYTIRLGTVSRGFANRFKDAIESITARKANISEHDIKRIWKHPKKTYTFTSHCITVKIYSKEWFYKLKTLKESLLKGFISPNAHYLQGIIRGFYESEGYYCAHTYRPKSHFIGLCNKNLSLLKIMKEILQRIGIEISGIYPHESSYVLQISKRINVQNFARVIGVEKP